MISLKNIFKKEKGFALIIAILVLTLMSILGLAIMTVSTSNFKMVKIDSKNQSAYYIGEAGINKTINNIGNKVNELSEEILSHDEFFQQLDNYIDKELENRLEDFEENKGEQPLAEITIKDKKIIKNQIIGNFSQRIVSYEISSIGKIGDATRTVSTTIETAHGIQLKEDGVHDPAFDYVLYSPNPLEIPNESIINGDFYSRDIVLKSAGSQIGGNIISETFVDIKGNHTHPRVKGNVYALNGDVKVSEGGLATVEGEVHARGNIIIGSSGKVNKSVFSIGDIRMKSANAKIEKDAHASGNIEMQSGAFIGGNVYLDGNLSLKNSNSIVNGNVFAGGDIKKDSNTSIKGSSQAGGDINQDNPNKVNMEIHPDNKPMNPKFSIIDKILPPTMTSFSSDMNKHISVPQSSSNYIIEPGIYGNLFVGGGSRVTLKSGNYIFNSIDGQRWGQSLRLDLRNGPINVYSVGDIKYTGPIYLLNKKGEEWVRMDKLKEEEAIRLAGMVYWETHGNFELDNSADPRQWFGTVLADKNITVGNPVNLIGAYVVNRGRISLGNSPTITYAPPTGSAAGNGGDSGETGSSGGEDGKGKNNVPEMSRIRISDPIREK